MPNTPEFDSKAACRASVLTALTLAGIMAVALALRLYCLGAESFWWDEYTSLMHLGAPNLWTFLRLNRTLDPATLPLYYSLEYLWWHHVSASAFSLRFLSIFLGLCIIPVMYLLGRELYGKHAGLIAALCVALSPIHTFHAQGIRMYVLMTLLAALSAYTFIKVMHGGRGGWWAAHAAANLLLLWTHPFALLLVGVEGAFVVLFFLVPKFPFGNVLVPEALLRGSDQSRASLAIAFPNGNLGTRKNPHLVALTWIALNLLLTIPSATYLATVRFWGSEQTETWLHLPNPVEFLSDIFADDVISSTYQLRISEGAWGFLGARLAALMITMRPAFDAGLVLFIGAAISFMLYISIRMFDRDRANIVTPPSSAAAGEDAGVTKGRESGEKILFLLTWLILPPLALYALSHVWRPCIFPRYTLHCSLALYLILGAAIARLRAAYKLSALAALVLLFSYQIGLVHPGPQRTDYLSASHILKTQGAPDDPGLVQVSIWKDVLAYNMGETTHPLSSAETLPVLADEADFLLALRQTNGANDSGIWAVIARPYFDSGPSEEFEKDLGARRLTFTRTELSGIEHLNVYRISRRAPEPAPPKLDATYDYVQSYGDLAVALAEKGALDYATAAIRKAVTGDPRHDPVFGNLMAAIEKRDNIESHVAAVRALRRGYQFHRDFAAAEFRKAIEYDPNYAMAYGEFGKILVEMGDYDGALPSLRKACELSAELALRYGRLADVIAEKGNIRKTLEAQNYFFKAVELGDSGKIDAVVDTLQKGIKTDPKFTLCYFALGLTYLMKNDPAAAVRTYKQAFQFDARFASTFQPLATAILETKDYGKAWDEVARLRDLGVEVPEALLTKLEHDSGRKN